MNGQVIQVTLGALKVCNVAMVVNWSNLFPVDNQAWVTRFVQTKTGECRTEWLPLLRIMSIWVKFEHNLMLASQHHPTIWYKHVICRRVVLIELLTESTLKLWLQWGEKRQNIRVKVCDEQYGNLSPKLTDQTTVFHEGLIHDQSQF